MVDGDRPRLMTKAEVATYCGVEVDTLGKWVARRIVPGPMLGTRRWDRVALDRALDRLSGIDRTPPEVEANPFEWWDRRRAERKAARKKHASDRLAP